ncbi:MAG: cation transporter [Proteobacteria bacterium]|nr:cation transporter [Pseudomonadota bacterium]
MPHDHAHHSPHDHGHGHGASGAATGTEARILWALVLTAGFMVVEFVGGVLSGSLALIADAGHMLADAAALALAFVSLRIARRPADLARSYGYHRLEVLAAFVNGLVLLALVAWIVIEAIRRLVAPIAVTSDVMLVIAVLGLAVNVVSFAILSGGDRTSLNLHGALLHVLSDMLGSVAAIVAALVIGWTGWLPIDPLLSLVAAALLVRSSWMLVRRSAHVLLEGTPEGLDLQRLRTELGAAVPGLKDIHHVHAWSLTSGRPLLTLHGTIHAEVEGETVLRQVKRHLELAGFSHTVVQLERDCPDDEHH